METQSEREHRLHRAFRDEVAKRQEMGASLPLALTIEEAPELWEEVKAIVNGLHEDGWRRHGLSIFHHSWQHPRNAEIVMQVANGTIEAKNAHLGPEFGEDLEEAKREAEQRVQLDATRWFHDPEDIGVLLASAKVALHELTALYGAENALDVFRAKAPTLEEAYANWRQDIEWARTAPDGRFVVEFVEPGGLPPLCDLDAAELVEREMAMHDEIDRLLDAGDVISVFAKYLPDDMEKGRALADRLSSAQADRGPAPPAAQRDRAAKATPNTERVIHGIRFFSDGRRAQPEEPQGHTVGAARTAQQSQGDTPPESLRKAFSGRLCRRMLDFMWARESASRHDWITYVWGDDEPKQSAINKRRQHFNRQARQLHRDGKWEGWSLETDRGESINREPI